MVKRTDMRVCVVSSRVTEEERKTIKRRASAAGVTMDRYIADMALYGKVQHMKPK